jgi:uncharacterized protein (TIGR02594 family)
MTETRDPALLLLEIARKYVGVKEIGGENRGPEVEAFQKAVDGVADREPWCMSFVQHCIQQVEEELKVNSPLLSSEHCLSVWRAAPKECILYHPEAGSIAIWQMNGTLAGHTGIVERVEADAFHTIEGNTSNGSGVVREGDGVYRRVRKRSGSGKMRLLGFLRPFPKYSIAA